jgi:hypothetical protein
MDLPPCPPGSLLNPSTGKCEATPTGTCFGGTFNPVTLKCEADPRCNFGGDYNRFTDKCEVRTGLFEPCPSGYIRTDALTCEGAPQQCPGDTQLNTVTDKCEGNPTRINCPQNTSFNSATKKCEATPTPACPQGTFLNTAGKCEGTPICPPGSTFVGSNPNNPKCKKI